MAKTKPHDENKEEQGRTKEDDPELTRQMSPSDMRPRSRNVMPTNPLPSLSMRVDFRVVVVPRPGDGSVAYCVGAASSTGVSGSGVSGSGVSGRGRVLRSVLVTESEDHDERLMSLMFG